MSQHDRTTAKEHYYGWYKHSNRQYFYNRLVLENPSNNFNVWDVKNGKVNQ